jgi:4-hydroxybenzoate polyprenyltransferase
MALFDRLKLLFGVSRPLFWVILPSVYIAGITYSGNHPGFTPTTLIAFALSFPSCLSEFPPSQLYPILTKRTVTFGVNDVYDYHSDKQNLRKRNQWIDGEVLNPMDHEFILQASRISTVLVLLLAIPAAQMSPLVLACIATLLFLAWNYSSPPLRLKERPIVDSLSNGAILGLAWACGYTCNGRPLLSQSSGKAVIGVWFVACYGSACHALAAIADVKPDAFAKHRTTATVLGERVAALCAALYL